MEVSDSWVDHRVGSCRWFAGDCIRGIPAFEDCRSTLLMMFTVYEKSQLGCRADYIPDVGSLLLAGETLHQSDMAHQTTRASFNTVNDRLRLTRSQNTTQALRDTFSARDNIGNNDRSTSKYYSVLCTTALIEQDKLRSVLRRSIYRQLF